MIYILMIWTVVSNTTMKHNILTQQDWRPLGEFHAEVQGRKTAKQMCEDAARQLGLETENYRCVRSK